ncbi:MAG: general secretion pathway protein GspE [Chthonomonadaceae bacterium]|uniref:Type II secretory pathway, ATPase PulE/Tfp pilus assembly pathway, ATPase PilB n=1 Tax=Candidatus Nitrosymbiomonas proteolyticus TaxID=2608984 RepID=A0A809SB44_9BACT|nr:type II secretory pathway, ATPase PulE/Tfp pilus assembly pathway, ATPase PilB [Candidatus Nitrosymbiomonas proteolyticus]
MSISDHSQFNWGAAKRFRLILRESGMAKEMGGDDMSLAVGIVDNIFISALETNTSDIHLQPERDQLKIRYRQDGVLHATGQLPPEQAANVLARLKLSAGMRIDETREPQDGRIDMEFMGRRLSARASCVPCLNGEKFVMRILDPAAMRVELQKLGMPEDVLTKWQRAVQVPYGLVIVTGPTGSGKTSTLYASINTLDHVRKNIVTVEDPVEYEFENNIAQVQVTEKMSFPRVMRSFLRQDPDIMLVGEMRDPESLSIGIQAGLTGHLVLTTLHTNNAVETVGRMIDMGAEPYLIAGTTVAIMAQRLVRLNCAKCRQPYSPTEEELQMLSLTSAQLEGAQIMAGKGCAECRGTGYKGRTAVFELILGTPDLRQAIAHKADYPELVAAARKQGYRTMLEDGITKILQGWTTPDEVLRAVYTQAIE